MSFLLAQKIYHKKLPSSNRLTYCSWIIFTMILSIAYSTRFYSMLTMPTYEKPINTIDDLMDALDGGRHQIINLARSSYFEYFLCSDESNKLFDKIRQNIIK